ncbi:hypothetical protein FRC03_000514 [Tulasnella sp. 419]|nr:hypothetical protein FRC02_012050 [Tulasnella sp. 418]KAG8965446.1 hypothetical protein FRC03_000514 [Tulasnella sp. 419]
MSRPLGQPNRRPGAPMPGLARTASALRAGIHHQQQQQASSLPSIPEYGPVLARRPSVGHGVTPSPSILPSSLPTKIANAPSQKTQRTSKTSQKLVVLPSEPQTRPLPDELRTDGQVSAPGAVTHTHEHRSEGEKMGKEERQRAGFKRLTAYCVAGGFRMKLLAAFLKREHGVQPRTFDEAIYAVYHLPLLPGYGANVNIRSSPPKSPGVKSILSRMSEAEEYGYNDTYFSTPDSPVDFSAQGGFISTSPPILRSRRIETLSRIPEGESEVETDGELDGNYEGLGMELGPDLPPPIVENVRPRPIIKKSQSEARREEDRIAEVVVFDYGVVVFFGFEEGQERDFLDDLDKAMICVRPMPEAKWEVEECHYVYDPSIPSPRIYNDFFTFKTHSHLLKISLSHAIAQSVLLGHYESSTQTVLFDTKIMSIPKQLASTGEFKLGRTEALRLTGRLFKLRRDVNLVSNVLDTPELFWSEASLKDLYDACREYFEIEDRVGVLNERMGVTSDLLDLILEHLDNGAMHRITWIIIWLIVVACLVELGEVIARIIVAASSPAKIHKLAHGEALKVIESLMQS